jgi:hypothetical protein
MPHPDGQYLRLDEAIQFLNGSEFMPPESQPAEVVFDKRSAFHFGTPRPGLFPENNVWRFGAFPWAGTTRDGWHPVTRDWPPLSWPCLGLG